MVAVTAMAYNPAPGAADNPEAHAPYGFEGSEKRLEIDFVARSANAPASNNDSSMRGLRDIPRRELDAMLEQAQCMIVSHTSNSHFDAYVLSESSLFVYPSKMMIKTCGTTGLLRSIPLLLASAAAVGKEPARVRYSRACYAFPEEQPRPHGSFDDEVAFLETQFGHLGDGGEAYVLGTSLRGLRWHVYAACAADDLAKLAVATETPAPRATYTLEMCMTELDRDAAAHFERDAAFVDAKTTTKRSGISALFPKAEIDDFVFDPCGYSMNGLDGETLSTIHVTPEADFSYASVELSGFQPLFCGNGDESMVPAKVTAEEPVAFIERALRVFRPGKCVVALSCDSADAPEADAFPAPEGYVRRAKALQSLESGGWVRFVTFASTATFEAERSAAKARMTVKPPKQGGGSTSAASSDSEEDQTSFEPETPSEPAPMRATCISDSGGSSSRCTSPSSSVSTVSSIEEMSLVPATAATKMVTIEDSDAVASKIYNEYHAKTGSQCMDAIAREILSESERDLFYLMDLETVLQRWRTWTKLLPRVTPHYAVKCNHDPALVALLASLGTGFDCASPAELEQVLSLGVSPERIVFANCCKLPAHIAYASKVGVRLTTFDTEAELRKIKDVFPESRLLLRIRADDPAARCPLGDKYGAEEDEVPGLLREAKRLGLDVAGVAFHVGSGASDPASFPLAVAMARQVFDAAEELGFEPNVLDIGGGFAGGGGGSAEDGAEGVTLVEVARGLNDALQRYFPSPDVRIISEPGRFFAEAAATLYARVFGLRTRKETGKEGETTVRSYWIADGIYGSMNCLLYDHAHLEAHKLKKEAGEQQREEEEALFRSTVFGPTCDGLDTILRDVQLPALTTDDVLVFPNMGAYTTAAGSCFNGFNMRAIPTFYAASASADDSSSRA
mmetsp:Transcript_29250/g.95321  ORF Transcript_29250/g.95321 Transcript_29250/m.95321 type:complete len:906 (-) Transcript_29250:30-2747(-)|eukprot:CAMPEP_0170132910 /NCGR_PEP_ID=MMETSP0033_2-20121228/948_1 /TAXON_ID=195969 /ORGANISM="Dolichomastix tenuilepis, Strain CCMP3274" /LENGTH=905 /DNA_ID=CAMNT_0010368359 /DNA_START=379 /DNA_END=3096 /DNA_ORIENTATION=+